MKTHIIAPIEEDPTIDDLDKAVQDYLSMIPIYYQTHQSIEGGEEGGRP